MSVCLWRHVCMSVAPRRLFVSRRPAYLLATWGVLLRGTAATGSSCRGSGAMNIQRRTARAPEDMRACWPSTPEPGGAGSAGNESSSSGAGAAGNGPRGTGCPPDAEGTPAALPAVHGEAGAGPSIQSRREKTSRVGTGWKREMASGPSDTAGPRPARRRHPREPRLISAARTGPTQAVQGISPVVPWQAPASTGGPATSTGCTQVPQPWAFSCALSSERSSHTSVRLCTQGTRLNSRAKFPRSTNPRRARRRQQCRKQPAQMAPQRRKDGISTCHTPSVPEKRQAPVLA